MYMYTCTYLYVHIYIERYINTYIYVDICKRFFLKISTVCGNGWMVGWFCPPFRGQAHKYAHRFHISVFENEPRNGWDGWLVTGSIPRDFCFHMFINFEHRSSERGWEGMGVGLGRPFRGLNLQYIKFV